MFHVKHRKKGDNMAVRSRDELLASYREISGDSTDDKSLAFVEDLTDTMSDYDSRLADSTDWKTKYEENDASWRRKYAERFYNPSAAQPGGNNPTDTLTESGVETDAIVGRYEDLFKTDTGTWRR